MDWHNAMQWCISKILSPLLDLHKRMMMVTPVVGLQYIGVVPFGYVQEYHMRVPVIMLQEKGGITVSTVEPLNDVNDTGTNFSSATQSLPLGKQRIVPCQYQIMVNLQV